MTRTFTVWDSSTQALQVASTGDFAPLGINEHADDYTLALGDAGIVIEMNKGTAVTVTVPKNSSVAFSMGTIVGIRQKGAGTVTIAPVDGDVTINYTDGLSIIDQYGVAVLLKVGSNTWSAFGALE